MNDDVISFLVYGKCEPRGSKMALPVYEVVHDRNGNEIPNPVTGKPTRRAKHDKFDRVVQYIVDDNSKSKAWMRKVRRAAMTAMNGREPSKSPVKLTMDFYLERPQYHFGTGKNAGRLKAQFVNIQHTVKPDRGKLARAIEDALSKLAYEDDGQIIDGAPRKHYCEPGQLPRVEIQVEFLPVAAVPAKQQSLIA